jgi:hypothetical protein
MRPIHAIPLLAVFALAACADGDDEGDNVLSSADIAGISDNGTMPQAGEYSTSEELIELDAPGMTEESIATMRSEFAEGAEEPHLYCVTEETTREEWLSAMTGSNCTLSSLDAEGNSLEGAMTCSADEGLNGRVEFAGTANDSSANLRMTYSTPSPAGDVTARFSVRSERSGEACG